MTENLQQIKNFYEEAFEYYKSQRQNSEIDVRFYPYIGINHTIRVRDGKVFVRLAEICREMPLTAQKALAFILVSKLLQKKVPADARKIYSSFVKTQEIQVKAAESKRAKGRKVITTSKGAAYDLEKIFERLNILYFQNAIPKPVLTWSARKTYRILGHHDSTHETIAISRSLDSKKVPEYVVEYVVFHEMLHIHHPTTHRNGRRYNHTPAFRRDEEKFAYYKEAESWIERNVKNLKRNAKK
ncbi:MAG: SprT-like domain-containing protein [Pyrinomonadaceae bacterium]